MRGVRARYIYQPDGSILENGILLWNRTDRRIEESRPCQAGGDRNIRDLGDVMLLPGFINAHCHLEYSALKGRIPAGLSFADWIEQLVRLKEDLTAEELSKDIEPAIRDLLSRGATTICDNLSLDLSAPPLARSPIRALVFLEVLQFLPDKAESAFDECAGREEKIQSLGLPIAGFAPHAPFSVSEDLFRTIADAASQSGRMLSVHVAETLEEVEFIKKGSGPLAETKRRFGTLPNAWQPPGISPVAYLQSLGLLRRTTLLIHANYLQADDFRRIADSGAGVVFCPGTHRFFNRDPYPISQYMKHDIPLCLGTDSLASNECLDLVGEMELARQHHPRLKAKELIDMVTTVPANLLGLHDRGALRPGKAADFSVWEWPYRAPEEWLDDKNRRCLGTYIDGVQVI